MLLYIDALGLHRQDLEWYQMMIRAVIVFIISLAFIRLSGMRTFGTQSAFDVVVAITLGGMLSKAIMGHYPFFTSLAASATLASMHRLTSFLGTRSKLFSKMVEGEPVILYKEGVKYPERMRRYNINEKELSTALHEQNLEGFDSVDAIRLEYDGKLSVTKKSA